MPIDTGNQTVALQAQPIKLDNPIQMAGELMQMKALGQLSQIRSVQAQQAQQEFNDNQSMRQAFKQNMVTMPDGSQQLNRQGVISDLNMVNPMLAAKASLNFRQLDLDQLTQQHAIAKQILFGIDPTNQSSLDQAIQKANQLGLPPLQNLIGTSVSDPSFRQKLLGAQKQSLSAEEQLNQQKDQAAMWAQSINARANAVNAGMGDPGMGPAAAGGGAPLSQRAPQAQRAASNLVASNNQGIPGGNGATPSDGQIPGAPFPGFKPPPKMMAEAMKNYQSALDASRQQRADIQQSYKDIQSADKINEAVKNAPGGDPNQMNTYGLHMVTSELVKMLTGGVPSDAELEKMNPDTIVQKYAGLIQSMTGQSVPANAKAFITQFRDYANGIGKQSIDRIMTNNNDIAARFRPFLGESAYQMVTNQNAHEFDGSLTRKILRLQELKAKAGQ